MITGYDTDSWNWDTNEVCRWIENDPDLYATCQGQSAHMLAYHVGKFSVTASTGKYVDVTHDAVNWAELAQFFGADHELAPDAHLDDVGD